MSSITRKHRNSISIVHMVRNCPCGWCNCTWCNFYTDPHALLQGDMASGALGSGGYFNN